MEAEEAPKLIGRRKVLRDLGLVAAGGVGLAASLGVSEAAAAVTAVTAINVKDAPYSATGNGTTDDRAAIQAALNDVPANGGMVFFPPGDYAVSGPLVPKSRTLMYGTHTPLWGGGTTPTAATRIRVRTGFSGSGLIVPGSTTVAVTMRDLALVGAGIGTGIHGLRMPDASAAAGNGTFRLEGVSIGGFSGSGIYGTMQVAHLHACFIHENARWGIEASNGNAWLDCHVAESFFYYNKLGHVYFGGSGISGACTFVNCRFDRAGANPANVGSPSNATAPGVRIASALYISFIGCATDANCGNGFEIVHEADTPSYLPHHILLTTCRFNRDGTGNQSSLGDFAGLKIRGTNSTTGAVGQVKAVNCTTAQGKAADDGSGTVEGPKYGVWYENTNHLQWIGGQASATSAAGGSPYYVGTGNNWRTAIYDVERGLFSLPLDAPELGVPIPDGSAYFDGATNRINVRNGGAWKSVLLA